MYARTQTGKTAAQLALEIGLSVLINIRRDVSWLENEVNAKSQQGVNDKRQAD
ncbi:MAG TPA: hypothetical protein VIZ65_06485 [Cellvibrionaceae bacterium]